MAENLTADDERRLKAIFEPTVVWVLHDDARRGLCVMPDGEIRSYGLTDNTNPLSETARSCLELP